MTTSSDIPQDQIATTTHKRKNKALPGFATILLAVLLVAALIAGTSVLTLGVYTMRQQQQTSPEIVATTTISGAPVTNTVSATLTAVASHTQTVTAQGTVTRDGVKADGQDLPEGTVLAVIDEHPIVALQGNVPAWRSIAPGSSGADVSQLQDALRRLGYSIWDTAGTYGQSTAAAWYHFLSAHGYQPTDAEGNTVAGDAIANTGVPKNTVVFAPLFPLRAANQCGSAGQTATGTICTITSSERTWQLSIAAGILESPKDPIGKHAFNQDSSITGTVGEQIGDTANMNATSTTGDGTASDDANQSGDTSQQSPTQDDAGDQASQTLTYGFTIDDGKSIPVTATSADITVTIATSAKDTLSVDAVAIRGSGKKLWLEAKNGTHISITTDYCYAGRCSFTSNASKAKAGTVVTLPKQDGAA